MKDFLKFIGILFLFIAFILFSSWIFFWISYFEGWIASLFIGKYLTEGFALLGINIPVNKIPLIAGFLGWIGGFFKVYSFNKKNNN